MFVSIPTVTEGLDSRSSVFLFRCLLNLPGKSKTFLSDSGLSLAASLGEQTLTRREVGEGRRNSVKLQVTNTPRSSLVLKSHPMRSNLLEIRPVVSEPSNGHRLA